MSTIIRPELSVKNMYWIEKHRYYELKHFCLQYPIWKAAYAALDGLSKRPLDLAAISKSNAVNDPTSKCAEAKSFYIDRINLIERVAEETDLEMASYVLKAVTEGWSYDNLRAKYQIPCCKDVYYKMYRKFFWLLNKERD